MNEWVLPRLPPEGVSQGVAEAVGSDLHDGPSQTLAFAMLRLDAVEGRLEAAGQTGDADLQAVRGALQEALAGMRTIAAGLRTPELERATPDEIARAKRSSRAG